MKSKDIYPRFSLLMSLLCMTLLSYSQSLPEGYPETNRQKIILVDGWDYYLDKGESGFHSTLPQVSNWEEVTIPHTLQLASLDLDGCEDDHYQLTFHRWIGWYKRDLQVNAAKGQRVYLEFEGAHQVTRCWVNGKYVGEHAVGGYTPFHFDITDYVKPGKANQVVLSVDNRRNVDVPPEGDRYDYIKWSGLYRDVYLVVTDPLHITFPFEDKNRGVFITTPTVTNEDATVSIRTHVKNESSTGKNCKVINRVIDMDGIVVLKLESEKLIPAGSDFNFSQTGGIEEDVRLWSIEDPYLYRVNTLVLDGGKPVDCVENPLGIRRIEFIDGRGFVLNGKDVELIGVNRHQGMLTIGDAVPNSLHWKDAWLMKKAGMNSVRLAHYPHDDSFVKACDQLGILVYEEPPTWIAMGGEKWMDNLEEATRRMVRAHRNNPSLLFWGTGINHRGPVERLHYAAKDEDPTRPTASNGAPWTGPRNSGVTDIYSPMDYQNRPIQANEFTYLCEHGGGADASGNQFETSKSRQNANMIGVALWVAHGYQSFKRRGGSGLGTRTPWTSYRMPNMPFYWYKSELRKEPMVFITDGRASTENEIVVFSNCQKVELYNDGELVETGYPQRETNLLYINHPSIKFAYEWVSGELTAKGYIDDRVAAKHSRKIPGEPNKLKVKIARDNTDFYANGSDIKMVYAYVVDENGTVVPDAKTKVTFSVEGDGAIIGNEELGANPNEAFWGVASAYLKSGKEAGNIKVSATAEGLVEGSGEITTIPFEKDRILAEAKPIYDLKYERVDLASMSEVIHSGDGGNFEIGGDRVLESFFLQFGWTAWIGEGETETFKSSVFEGCEMDLSFKDGEPTWFTNWGFVSNLPYLATDGVQVASGGEIVLTLKGLKKGVYTMKSYHNQPERSSNRWGTALQVYVSDMSGEDRLVERGLRVTSGNDLNNREPSSSSYSFESDGVNPVTIRFKPMGRGARPGAPPGAPPGAGPGAVLNGFVLSESLN